MVAFPSSSFPVTFLPPFTLTVTVPVGSNPVAESVTTIFAFVPFSTFFGALTFSSAWP